MLSLFRRRSARALARSAGQAFCEPLESRTLLAAISWDGDAGDNNWSTALNWSTNTVPTIADDVTINVAANPSITISSGAAVNSLVTNEALTLSATTLTVATTATIGTGGSFNLQGGTISGGNWSLAGGTFNTTNFGGSINNATLNFDLVLDTFSEAVTVTGTTRFGVARLQNSVNFRTGPGYVLRDNIVAEGAATGVRSITYAFGGAGSLTIDTANIFLDFACGGNLSITDSSTGQLTLLPGSQIVNNSTSRTLTIGGTTVGNRGEIRAVGGTTVISANTFDNTTLIGSPGTINALSSGAVTFSGTFDATDGIGTFNAAGATFTLTGTLLNTGASLTLGGANGSWVLQGGTISGGTVTAPGTSLSFSSTQSTLSGVAFAQPLTLSGTSHAVTLNNTSIAGDLTLSGSGANATVQGSTSFTAARLQNTANLRFAPGYTLNLPVFAEGATAGTRTVTIAFGGAGNLTIGAAGSIRLAAGAGGNLTISDSSTGTLINNGTIRNDATGRTLTISTTTFSNQNLLQANAGITTISPTTFQTNLGPSSISVGAPATLNLGPSGSWNIASGIGTWSNSGGIVNITGNLVNTGGTLTLNASTGSWTMSGGTITGGFLAFAGGSTLLYSSNGGTLTNVVFPGSINLINSSDTITLNNTSLSGSVLLTASSTTVTIQGTTSFNSIRLQNGNTTARFAPGYVLNNTVIAEGAATGTRTVTIAFGGAGNLTVGNSGANITIDPTSGGNLSISDSSTGTLINNGTIRNDAIGRTLSISPTTFTNNANLVSNTGSTLTITSTTFSNSGTFSNVGSTVNVNATNWTSPGAFGNTNATVNLGGSFATSTFNVNSFSRVSSTVNLTGTLNNTGNTFTFNINTGSWVLLGGTINNGSLTFFGGNTLLYSSSGGTLSGVTVPASIDLSGTSHTVTLNNTTINGQLIVSGSSASAAVLGSTTFTAARLTNGSTTIRFAPGYTLNVPLTAEGAGAGTRTVTIAFGGTGNFTVAPGNTITLAAGTGGNLSISDSNAGTLINNGTIRSLAGGRSLTLNPTTVTNNSLIEASDCFVTINPTTFTNAASGVLSFNSANLSITATNWTNPGSITSNNTVLNLGGTFTTPSFNFAGFSRVSGGVNITGTLNNTGATLALNGATGTWALVGGTINNGSISFAGGSTLALTSGLGTLSGVSVAGGLNLDGTSHSVNLNNTTLAGDLVLSGSSSSATVLGSTTFTAARLSGGSVSLRFAPGYVLSVPIIAEGATGGSRTITVAFGGTGTFTVAPSGSIRLAPGTGGGLTINESNSGTLINNGTISNEATGRTLTIATNTLTNNNLIQATAGTLDISPSNNTNLVAGTLSGGSYIATNAALTGSFGGVVRTLATNILQTGGTVVPGAFNTLTTITPTGSLTLSNGVDLTTTPVGGTFTNNGTLSLGPGSRLQVNGNATLSGSSTLRIQANGTNPATQHGVLAATGVVTAGGTLEATAVNAYDPARGDAQDFITAGTNTAGSFASASLFSSSDTTLKTRLIDFGAGFRIITTTVIDFNDDGNVDLADFFLFFAAFDIADPLADIDGEPGVDLADFFLFFSLYDQG